MTLNSYTMSCLPPLGRAPRLTRRARACAEAHQTEVIGALTATGDDAIARRLRRCQDDRQQRQTGWPWRCHSPGCWSCRRAMMRRWWRGFCLWLAGGDLSLALIPGKGDPGAGIGKLRKGLRDVRDRAARQDRRWAAVRMAGLASDAVAAVLVQHCGIDRAEVGARLMRRWSDVVLIDPGDITSVSEKMTVAHAAALARRRRGIEPIRIIVPPQMAALSGEHDAPMPLVLC